MPVLEFTADNLPTPEEFQQMLTRAMLESNPLDELLELAVELRQFEEQYCMSSAEFFAQYQRGEMGDDRDAMQWAMSYRTFLELKTLVEKALMREAVQRSREAIVA